jgi:anti-anti-sigma regulatory factor
MTLKIEATSDGRTATLRLIGRIESEHMAELEAQVRGHRSQFVLDLNEVTLADVAFVRFLIACEIEGIELRNCPPYIGEWMDSERRRG